MLASHEVHEVDCSGGVKYSERLREIEDFGVRRYVPVGDGMKGPASRTVLPLHANQPSGAGKHVAGGPARVGQQQNAIRRDSPVQQARHPGGQRPGLARARAGDDHKGCVSVHGDGKLFVVKPLVPTGGEHMFVW